MKGITKSVTMDLWLIGPKMNERAQQLEIGIKALGNINRLDSGVGESDSGALFSVSNQIDLRVLGEFRKSN